MKLIPLHIINQEIISLSALARTQYRRSIGTRTGTHVSAANQLRKACSRQRATQRSDQQTAVLLGQSADSLNPYQ
jgi:hypothetical protein